MNYPALYEQAPRIRMRDPLAAFLGAAGYGLLEYACVDAVRGETGPGHGTGDTEPARADGRRTPPRRHGGAAHGVRAAWQGRVQRLLLNHADDPQVLRLTRPN